MIIRFICPSCGENVLGSVEEVILTYPITSITDKGDLYYDTDNPTAGDGQVIAYQCMNCGFELKNEDENTIEDCTKVAEWCIKNCSQEY